MPEVVPPGREERTGHIRHPRRAGIAAIGVAATKDRLILEPRHRIFRTHQDTTTYFRRSVPGSGIGIMSTGELEAPAADLRITASAARRIKRILADEPAGALLRVAVNGGGCQGFSYDFAIERERGADDIAIERDGVTVVVDVASLELLAGSELDFIDSLIGQSFQVKNPNATSTCGCGTSFSL